MARHTRPIALLLATLVLPAFAACGESFPEPGQPDGGGQADAVPTGSGDGGPAQGLSRVEGCDDPDWLITLADELRGNGSIARISRTSYRGQTAYYVPAQYDDDYSSLYDACGEYLCAPSGSIAGGGDGRCPDYSGSEETVIWQDDPDPAEIYGHCCNSDLEHCTPRGCEILYDEATGTESCGQKTAGLVCD